MARQVTELESNVDFALCDLLEQIRNGAEYDPAYAEVCKAFELLPEEEEELKQMYEEQISERWMPIKN